MDWLPNYFCYYHFIIIIIIMLMKQNADDFILKTQLEFLDPLFKLSLEILKLIL